MKTAAQGLVVMCGGSRWDGPWSSDKQIAVRLKHRAPVLWVDPPASIVRLLKSAEGRTQLRQPLDDRDPDLVRLTPVTTPGVSRPGLRRIARGVARWSIRRAIRQLGGDVAAVVVGSLDDFFGVAPDAVSVLYGTDDFVAGGALMDLSVDWLKEQELAQLERSDVIVAVSEPLAERWRQMGFTVTVIPNGCDTDQFIDIESAAAPQDLSLPAPIAGVIGHLSERIDVRCLEAVADTGHSLLLVGPIRPSFEPERLKALLQRPNVQWVGEKPYEELPSYLRCMKVGLTPYVSSAFNDASFPLKTLEYLAAGRAAVSTDLPAARWLDTDLVIIAGTPEDFASKVATALQAVEPADLPARRREFAARHSWDRRADELGNLVGLPERAEAPRAG